MNEQIERIKKTIEPLRHEIIHHKVYSVIKDIDDLKLFMQYHVYAVWDFMSLLKSLQNNLTCTSVPWFPFGDADTRYLINEIVAGEESDIDMDGNRKSHFEIYLDAMKQCNANTTQIETFAATLKQSNNLESAFTKANTPKAAKDFVNYTFDIITGNRSYLQAAIFTFGREDLLPGMFISIVNDMNERFPNDISIFKYYLERHIEIDGGHHSHLALQMTSNLCNTNERFWIDSEEATIVSLQKRIALWDGVYNEITKHQ